MEEPRSLPVGELDLRHDEMTQIGQVLKIQSKYKTEGSGNQDHTLMEQWKKL